MKNLAPLTVLVVLGVLLGTLGWIGFLVGLSGCYLVWCSIKPLSGLAWAFVALPLGIPEFDIGGLHGRPFEAVLWPAVLLAILYLLHRRALPPVEMRRRLWPAWAALAYLMTAGAALWGDTSALEIRLWFSSGLLMVAMYGAGEDPTFRRQLILAITCSAGLMLLVSLSQRLTGGPLFAGLEEPRDIIQLLLFKNTDPIRIANSTFQHSNAAGAYLTILLPTLVAYAVAERSRVAWVGVILAAATLYLTYSRGATVAVGLGLLAVLWNTLHRNARRWLLLTAGLTVAVAVGALVPVLILSPYILTISLGVRALIWRAYIFAWLESPIVGLGPGNAFHEAQFLSPYGSLYAAHNNYLYILADYGILGLGALVSALAYHVYRARKEHPLVPASQKPWLAGLTGMVLALAIHSMFDHTLAEPAYRIALFGFIGLAARMGVVSPTTLTNPAEPASANSKLPH